ncbi:Thioredoxin-like fold,Glutathione peroxidase, partial [Cinara cedri]
MELQERIIIFFAATFLWQMSFSSVIDAEELSSTVTLENSRLTVDNSAKTTTSIYDITVKDLNGNDVCLNKYKGQVLLIVNYASACLFTSENVNSLSELALKYGPQGLKVLIFPSNTFYELTSKLLTKCEDNIESLRSININHGLPPISDNDDQSKQLHNLNHLKNIEPSNHESITNIQTNLLQPGSLGTQLLNNNDQNNKAYYKDEVVLQNKDSISNYETKFHKTQEMNHELNDDVLITSHNPDTSTKVTKETIINKTENNKLGNEKNQSQSQMDTYRFNRNKIKIIDMDNPEITKSQTISQINRLENNESSSGEKQSQSQMDTDRFNRNKIKIIDMDNPEITKSQTISQINRLEKKESSSGEESSQLQVDTDRFNRNRIKTIDKDNPEYLNSRTISQNNRLENKASKDNSRKIPSDLDDNNSGFNTIKTIHTEYTTNNNKKDKIGDSLTGFKIDDYLDKTIPTKGTDSIGQD